MNNTKILLNEAGIQYSVDDDSLIFNYTFENETVTFRLREESDTDCLILYAATDISIDRSNMEEVIKFLNIVNNGLPFGAFVLTNCCNTIGFKDTLRIYNDLPNTEYFIDWLIECHSMYLAYAKITPSISQKEYSAAEAFTDLLRAAENSDDIEENENN